jgi:hypothetical protein
MATRTELRKENRGLRARIRELEDFIEGQRMNAAALLDGEGDGAVLVENGILSRLLKPRKTNEYDIEAHHKRDVDLSIYPSQTFRAENKLDAMKQAKAWLRKRLEGGGRFDGAKVSDYQIKIFRSDQE